jgi:ferredoxin--NADP+ reductase
VELRELDHSPNLQVLVQPEGMEFDAGSQKALSRSKSLRMVVDVLSEWAIRDADENFQRRIHIHFLENPLEVIGEDGKVVGLRTEHQELTGDGDVRGTGEFTTWNVQAVYRAVGYRSEAIEDLPFDTRNFVLPNREGRVLDLDGQRLSGIYATGWVKRGPVGLIGHTKSDAAETVANLLADAPELVRAPVRDREAVLALLASKSLPVTDFQGWDRLDAHERSLGEPVERERIKLHSRDEMTKVAVTR